MNGTIRPEGRTGIYRMLDISHGGSRKKLGIQHPIQISSNEILTPEKK